MRKLLILLMFLFIPSLARAQQAVIGASCPASGQSAISTTGVPVQCTQVPGGGALVWTAVGGSGGGITSVATTYEILNTPIASPFTGQLIVGTAVVNGPASVTAGAGFTQIATATIGGSNLVSLEYQTGGSAATIAAPWTITSGAWGAAVTSLQATNATLAQSNFSTTAQGSTFSTLSSVTSGQAIVLAIRYNGGQPTTGVSGCGATWTEAGIRAPENGFDGNWAETWVGLNTSAGACTATVAGITGSNVAYVLAVFNGVTTTNAIYDYNISTTGGSSTTPSATTNPQSTYAAIGPAPCSGIDIAVVLNGCVFPNITTTGGQLEFAASANPYLIKSGTQESNIAKWCGICIPGQATITPAQYIFKGQGGPIWLGEIGTPGIATGGTLFLVSPQAWGTAYQSTSNILSAIYAFGQSVAHVPGFAETYFRDLAIRQPYNQLAGAVGLNMSNAIEFDYDNILTDYNENYGQIAIAPVALSTTYGMVTMQSGQGNIAHLKGTISVGSYYGYAILTEHTTGESMTTIYSTWAGVIGPGAGQGPITIGCCIFHPMAFTKMTDQENINGWLYGSNMGLGTMINWESHDIETHNAGAYLRNCNFQETNPGYTTGHITYTYVLAGGGISSVLPPGNEFCSGGQGYFGGMFSNAMEYGVVRYPGVDSGTRSGGTATSWGPAWLALGASNGFCNSATAGATIASNAFVGTAKCYYAAVAGQTNQLAKATVASVSSTSSVAVAVFASTAGTTNQSRYEYICSTSGGLIAKRTINVVSATGVATPLVATAANSGCTGGGGDILELDVIHSDSGSNTLVGYYTVSGGSQVVDLVTTDSTLSSGQPGLSIVTSSGVGTASNFSGGPLPAKNTTESIYTRPAIHPSYLTSSNCAVNSASPAACGAAAAGAFVIPTTTTSYTVNTTAVTPNSIIILTPRTYTGNLPSAPTCVVPTITAEPVVSAISAGVSFTITETSTTGQTCWNYWVVN